MVFSAAVIRAVTGAIAVVALRQIATPAFWYAATAAGVVEVDELELPQAVRPDDAGCDHDRCRCPE